MTLNVEHLTKSFGERVAVHDLTFSIASGETFGLLGPNGAGKTTAISLICGLMQADSGTINLAGEPITVHSVAERRHIGYVPQEIAIYPDLTARENLSFFGKLNGLGRSELKERVAEVLEVLGLSTRADERTERFSGGMQRRLNIGLGLLHQPSLLVLDEPTVGVDPQSRNAIIDAVERLSGQGMALLYTTHYMEEAERLCRRVAIMDEGNLIALGTRRELVAQIDGHDRVHLEFDTLPSNDWVAAVDGVHSMSIDGRVSDITLDDANHRLPALLEAAGAAGGIVRSVQVIEPDLEAVFLEMTGKGLRDR